MKNLLFLGALALLLSASKCKDKVTFDIGQPFQLKVEQGGVSAAGDFGVKVDQIKEDSRCPKYTNCVWEGQVTVTVSVKEKGGKTQTFDMTMRASDKQSASRKVGEYQLRVKEVSPYPEAEKTIKKEDYVVTLLAQPIEKN